MRFGTSMLFAKIHLASVRHDGTARVVLIWQTLRPSLSLPIVSVPGINRADGLEHPTSGA